jgi:hypothetical protein
MLGYTKITLLESPGTLATIEKSRSFRQHSFFFILLSTTTPSSNPLSRPHHHYFLRVFFVLKIENLKPRSKIVI